MLYITFTISNKEKFTHFQRLYAHLVTLRTPGFSFEVDLESVDWATISDEEEALLFDQDLRQEKRYTDFFPSYAQDVIARYFQHDNEKLGPLGIQEVTSIMSYLEYDFEVALDALEQREGDSGIVQFSTGNYPYGGMERFLVVLKAFDLIPTECFNGFTVYEFDWTSEFEHNAIDLPEKTKEYVSK